MKTLLVLHTSLSGAAGLSSSLANGYVKKWLSENPDGVIVDRDFSENSVPHLTAERFSAFTTDAEERTKKQKDIVAYSDGLIAELQLADEILIALPMHNFGIPSTLKAYIDHIARAGVTFRYTADGPVGLLENKRAMVFATRGGKYLGTPADTQTAYMKAFLGFLGISDVSFVYAEGTAMGPEHLQAAIASAEQQIQTLAAIAA